jgi:VWFA-related protein
MYMPCDRLLPLLAAFAVLQAQPTFRSGVDLIRLDVSVMDRGGSPVRDLSAADFIVTVDGKPRQVSFARFYGPDEGARLSAALPPRSFASNMEAARGRALVIAVDVESIEPGSEKGVLDTAGALVDQLGPADWAALVPIPGRAIDLTHDHRRVREALERLRGSRVNNDAFQHTLSIKEAEEVSRKNRATIEEVIQRECLGLYKKDPNQEYNQCGVYIIQVEAPQLLIEADRRIRAVLHAMSDLTARLATIDAPRTLVLISAGLPYRDDLLQEFNNLRRSASAAGTTTYIIQLEQPETDATRFGLNGGVSFSRTDLAAGLSMVAGMTGATFRAGVGRAFGVFDSIRAEIMHTYQLGIESAAGDADGRVHTIDVQVRSPDAVVKARKEIVVSSGPRRPRNAMDVLGEARGFAELPMSASAYATLGDDGAGLKVIMLVETLAPGDSSYAVRIANGERTVFETSDALAAQQSGSRAVIAARIPTGKYSLRAAAIDREGRAGSVELPLTMALHEAGPLQCSDLILGFGENRFAPANYIPSGTPLTALLDIYAADPAQFGDVSVEFTLRAVGSDAILASVPATVNSSSSDRRQIAQGEFRPAAPGIYVVSAVVTRNGERLAAIDRDVVWR